MSKDKSVPENTPPPAAAPASAAAADQHLGRGGLYTVVNGVRQRASGTKAVYDHAKKG